MTVSSLPFYCNLFPKLGSYWLPQREKKKCLEVSQDSDPHATLLFDRKETVQLLDSPIPLVWLKSPLTILHERPSPLQTPQRSSLAREPMMPSQPIFWAVVKTSKWQIATMINLLESLQLCKMNTADRQLSNIELKLRHLPESTVFFLFFFAKLAFSSIFPTCKKKHIVYFC